MKWLILKIAWFIYSSTWRDSFELWHSSALINMAVAIYGSQFFHIFVP